MKTAADTRNYWLLVALGGALAAIGLAAAHVMEQRGHIVTGMTNQVVWGLPHVFAIFMIVAASGVLNVASIGSVFGSNARPVICSKASTSRRWARARRRTFTTWRRR